MKRKTQKKKRRGTPFTPMNREQTIDSMVAKLEKLYEFSVEKEKISSATRIMELIAKLQGLFVKPPVNPKAPFRWFDLTNEQIDAFTEDCDTLLKKDLRGEAQAKRDRKAAARAAQQRKKEEKAGHGQKEQEKATGENSHRENPTPSQPFFDQSAPKDTRKSPPWERPESLGFFSPKQEDPFQEEPPYSPPGS